MTFDEALAELQMATHELLSLVAQGEIRTFRDKDVLKFHRTDVLGLKKNHEPGAGPQPAAPAPARGPAAPASARGSAAPASAVRKPDTSAAPAGKKPDAEFLSFDEAIDELQMSTRELRSFVAGGEEQAPHVQEMWNRTFNQLRQRTPQEPKAETQGTEQPKTPPSKAPGKDEAPKVEAQGTGQVAIPPKKEPGKDGE